MRSKQKVTEYAGIWRWVCLFAFRRWRARWPTVTMPVGVPYWRDPESVCELYVPGKARWQDWNRCRGDGHYLCRECSYLRVEEEEYGS